MTNTIHDRENRRVLTSESSGWHASCRGGYESALQEEKFKILGLGRGEIRDGVKKCKVTIQRVVFLIFSFVISKETIRDVLLV